LSDIGRARVETMLRQPWIGEVSRLLSSGETKALETAAIVSAHTRVGIEVRDAIHENDRSATGFVPPERFEVLADAFFGDPDTSVEGWETSRAAQQRIVAATADVFTTAHDGEVLLVGHGAVGTLLFCHLAGLRISRSEDQVGGDAAKGGGNYWTYDASAGTMLHKWRPIDA
jgi:broad specificity phosphatase PhoE